MNEQIKTFIYPQDFEIEGGQINAIEIAARCRDLWHEVVVCGLPSVLVDKITELGSDLVASPRPGQRPFQTVTRQTLLVESAASASTTRMENNPSPYRKVG